MNLYNNIPLSHHQKHIIRDIAHTQIKSLIVISHSDDLMPEFENKKDIVKALLRDFSKVSQNPMYVFSALPEAKSLFKHYLFQLTMDKRSSNATNQLDEISILWSKICTDDSFSKLQLQ